MKTNKRSTGLGDTIEKITTFTGIKKVVHALFSDCGCDERKERLNKIFPYKVECLTEDEFEYLKNFNWNSYEINAQVQDALLKIYNRVFNLNHKPTKCRQCWIDIIKRLDVLYKEYLNELDEIKKKSTIE